MTKDFRDWLGAVLCGVVIGELAMFAVSEIRDRSDRAVAEEHAQAITDYAFQPPFQFTGGAEVRVRFTTRADMLSICGRGAEACYDTDTQRIITINPCYPEDPSWRSDDMRTLCHELAHSNGWSHVDPRDEKLQSTQAKGWRRR